MQSGDNSNSTRVLERKSVKLSKWVNLEEIEVKNRIKIKL